MKEIDRGIAMLGGLLKPYAAQLTSIWLPVQIGLIALAAIIAFGVAVLIRRRFDLVSLTMGLPPYVRIVLRALWDYLGTILFVVLTFLIQLEMQVFFAPSRSYLLGVAVSLATAWIVIVVLTSVIRNKLVNRMVAISAWTIAALSILGLLDRTQQALNSIAISIGGIKITPLLVIKTTALLLLALWAATAFSNFLDRRLHSLWRPHAVGAGAARQARPVRPDHGRGRGRDGVGRHRPLRARAVLRRGRRRHRLRPAEDRLQSGERNHPARRQVDQARRRHHGRRTFRLGDEHGRALHAGRHARRARVPHSQRGLRHPARDQLVLLERPGPARCEVRRGVRQRSACGAAYSPPKRRPRCRACWRLRNRCAT